MLRLGVELERRSLSRREREANIRALARLADRLLGVEAPGVLELVYDVPVRPHRLLGAVAELARYVDDAAALVEQ